MQEKSLNTLVTYNNVCKRANQYRTQRIQGFVSFTSQKDKRTSPLKSTKMYLEDFLPYATRLILNTRAHERFMRRKSSLTHTRMTTTNEKSSSSEINLQNKFSTLKLKQSMLLDHKFFAN